MWFSLYSDLDTFPGQMNCKMEWRKAEGRAGCMKHFCFKEKFACVLQGIKHVIHISYIQCIFQWEYIVNWQQFLPFNTERCKWTRDLLFSLHIQSNNLNKMWGFLLFSSGMLTGTERLSVLFLTKIVRDRNSWCSLNAKNFMCWLRKTDF